MRRAEPRDRLRRYLTRGKGSLIDLSVHTFSKSGFKISQMAFSFDPHFFPSLLVIKKDKEKLGVETLGRISVKIQTHS